MDEGPDPERLPRFRVRRIAPTHGDQPWIYATIGAWAASGPGEPALEFFLLSPVESPLHVELLSMVANYHADVRYRVGVGSVIDIGRGWLPGSSLDHLVVSLPYPLGPTFEWVHLGESHVRYLWLLPIYPSESALITSRGLEALEAKLESNAVDVLDPVRPPVG